jgi:hypothetical protein
MRGVARTLAARRQQARAREAGKASADNNHINFLIRNKRLRRGRSANQRPSGEWSGNRRPEVRASRNGDWAQEQQQHASWRRSALHRVFVEIDPVRGGAVGVESRYSCSFRL